MGKESDEKEMETHGEAGPRGFASVAGSPPLGRCPEHQTHLFLATPLWNTERKKKRLFARGNLGFSGGSDGKESACNVGDLSSIPWVGRFPGEGNGYPLQYSCLENSMDRGVWWDTVHGAPKSQT